MRKKRHQIKVPSLKKTYGVIKGLGNIELIQDIELIIHIYPIDETELNYIFKKLQNPDVYLSLGRYEDLIDIEEIKIVECKESEMVYTTHSIYVSIDQVISKGTIYNLPKEFYIDRKTGLRRFKEPIKVYLVPSEEVLVDTYEDENGYPVILC